MVRSTKLKQLNDRASFEQWGRKMKFDLAVNGYGDYKSPGVYYAYLAFTHFEQLRSMEDDHIRMVRKVINQRRELRRLNRLVAAQAGAAHLQELTKIVERQNDEIGALQSKILFLGMRK